MLQQTFNFIEVFNWPFTHNASALLHDARVLYSIPLQYAFIAIFFIWKMQACAKKFSSFNK